MSGYKTLRKDHFVTKRKINNSAGNLGGGAIT